MNDSVPSALPAGPPTRWAVCPRIGEGERSQLQVDSLLLTQLLWNRGVRTSAQAACFLAPSVLDDLNDPFALRGMDTAVERLLRAMAAGESVAVYGDYDVDGIAGAAVVSEAIRLAGATPTVYLPNRAREGHGLNVDALQHLNSLGVRVVVTVDCGITAGQEVARAKELGMDVIVTDHHTVPIQLPDALAVLNPHQDGCSYPFKELAGGGVALQLARGLLGSCLTAEEANRRGAELTDLAALSTVADMVPLVSENRVIVAHGLAGLREGRRPGLNMLCGRAGRTVAELTARDLAFSMIPRLNAAGRMGDARDALDLLLTQDADAAEVLAERLEQANGARRDQLSDFLRTLEGDVAEAETDSAIVIDGPYPVGLAGLLASRLVDRWQVPSVVIQREGALCRGSARAPEGHHLVQMLEQCSDRLIQFGGHARAAGFTLEARQIEPFRAEFIATARAGTAHKPPPERVLVADGRLYLQSVGPALADLVARFEPTGEGNPPPTFVSRAAIMRVEETNNGQVRLRVRDSTGIRKAVAFRPAFALPAEGSQCDLLYEVNRRYRDGAQQIELVVRDLAASAPVQSAV